MSIVRNKIIAHVNYPATTTGETSTFACSKVDDESVDHDMAICMEKRIPDFIHE